MTDIDWSKAPEGATHWGPENSAHVESWYKKCDGEWMFATYGNRWWGYLEDGMEREREIELIQRPAPPWSGDGLPPVGTVCEWRPSQDGWVRVEILGHSGEETWFRRDGNSLSETCLRMAFFRPIKTPAQIAAEEREVFARTLAFEMGKDPDSSPNSIAQGRRMYDLGYRRAAKGDDK